MSLLQLPHAQEHDFSQEDKNPAEGARARTHTAECPHFPTCKRSCWGEHTPGSRRFTMQMAPDS